MKLKKSLKNSQLTERHARSLLKLPEIMQSEVIEKVIDEGMTVRQTEELITLLTSTDEEDDKDKKEKKGKQTT